ncbi:hypothetical protein DFH09DRAFT_935384, partial [Mycena vulgaris]
SDLEAKALFEQAASIELASFNPQVAKLTTETVFETRQCLPIDEAAAAAAVSELSAKLDVYEVILGNQKFLAGNEVTLADLFHVIPRRHWLGQASISCRRRARMLQGVSDIIPQYPD